MNGGTTLNAVPKPPRKKKSSTQKIVAELDNLIRAILKYDSSFCCCCGSYSGELQVGHYIPRGKRWTRWNLENCWRQCPGCNLYHNHNPGPYTQFLLKQIGPDELTRVIEASKNIEKQTMGTLVALKEALKTRLELLEAGEIRGRVYIR